MQTGGRLTATFDRDIAAHRGGVYVLRVEDTDQNREVVGTLAQFDRAFAYFGLQADEYGVGAGETGSGPYQSACETIYLSYLRDLLRKGRA